MTETPLSATTRAQAFPFPILALSLSAFAIGTAEFVIAGLLPDISRDLGVSIPGAGRLVTAYAMGVVIGAPLLAVVTSRMTRKTVLLAMLGIFIVGNFLSAFSPELRDVDDSAHRRRPGAWLAFRRRRYRRHEPRRAGPTRQRGRLDVQRLDDRQYRRRAARHPDRPDLRMAVDFLRHHRARHRFAHRRWPRSFPEIPARAASTCAANSLWRVGREVLLALATTMLGSACVFVLFTYIAPILEDVSGFSPHAVAVILFILGVGLTIGINVGGKLADRGVMRALIGLLIVLAVLSALFAPASDYKIAGVIVLFLWGMAAFGMIPPLQTRVLDSAREAPNIASDAQCRRLQSRQCRRRISRRLGDRRGLWIDRRAARRSACRAVGPGLRVLSASLEKRRAPAT